MRFPWWMLGVILGYEIFILGFLYVCSLVCHDMFNNPNDIECVIDNVSDNGQFYVIKVMNISKKDASDVMVMLSVYGDDRGELIENIESPILPVLKADGNMKCRIGIKSTRYGKIEVIPKSNWGTGKLMVITVEAQKGNT